MNIVNDKDFNFYYLKVFVQLIYFLYISLNRKSIIEIGSEAPLLHPGPWRGVFPASYVVSMRYIATSLIGRNCTGDLLVVLCLHLPVNRGIWWWNVIEGLYTMLFVGKNIVALKVTVEVKTPGDTLMIFNEKWEIASHYIILEIVNIFYTTNVWRNDLSWLVIMIHLDVHSLRSLFSIVCLWKGDW